MAARALMVGSEILGLSGVTRDLDLMGELLVDRGFEVRRHDRDTATRTAVLQAFESLAADTRPGDSVVVYYSGHGGLALNTPASSGGVQQALQFIALTDYEAARRPISVASRRWSSRFRWPH